MVHISAYTLPGSLTADVMQSLHRLLMPIRHGRCFSRPTYTYQGNSDGSLRRCLKASFSIGHWLNLGFTKSNTHAAQCSTESSDGVHDLYAACLQLVSLLVRERSRAGAASACPLICACMYLLCCVCICHRERLH